MKTVNENLNLSGGGLKSEDLFEKIISLDNLFLAWKEFRKGKRKSQMSKSLKLITITIFSHSTKSLKTESISIQNIFHFT